MTNFDLSVLFFLQLAVILAWYLVGASALVLTAACLGKGVACWLAARLNGEPPDQAVVNTCASAIVAFGLTSGPAPDPGTSALGNAGQDLRRLVALLP